MAKKTLKSATGAAEEQLKAGAKLLQSQLVTAERAAERLAARAKERLPSPSEVVAMAAMATDAAKDAAKDVVAKRPGRGKGSGAGARVAAVPRAGADGPDDSWTVADLRAEAKRRGLTGYSRLTKTELLAQLRG